MSNANGAIDLTRAAELAVEAALAAGADEADAWCEDALNRTVRVYGGAVESVTEAGSRGGGLRVFSGGRTGYAFGSDLSEEGLRDLARAATGAAAVTEPDEYAGIQRDAAVAEVGPLASPDVDSWTMEQRVNLALAVELDPYVAASFVSVIGRALSADAVQRGRSLFADKEGERIADQRLRLTDDGTVPDGLATAPFDGEGMPQQRTVLIEDGTLRGFLFDAYTGRRGDHRSTGNGTRGSYRAPPSVGTTNLVVDPGEATDAELLAAAGEG